MLNIYVVDCPSSLESIFSRQKVLVSLRDECS